MTDDITYDAKALPALVLVVLLPLLAVERLRPAAR